MKNCKGKSLFTRRLFYCLATLAVLIITNSAIAQKTVTGQIKDKDGNPLAAATVAVKNKKVNAVADAEGRFTISAAPGDILLVTSVGYADVEIKLGDQATVMIELSLKVSSMEDVVIVGYGTQKKKDLTGSIVNINTNETKKYSTSDISQLLQGRASGVQVNSDGQPGAVPSVRIRGYSTFGNAQPFYVVDGVPGVTVRDFSPNDIETINVLKDASAGSIYGANAANGVIIITTKQGRKNSAMKVEYNGYYGWDKVWQIQDVTDREQYQMLSNESRTNAGLPLFPANNPADPRFVNNINTDWQKEGLKTGTRQNHNISMSGGGTNNTYFVSLDYFDNQGTYVGNGPTYTRYTARVNSSAEKGIFKMGEAFNYTHSHENSLTFRDDILLGGIPPLIGSLVVAIPTMPVYDPANLGGYGGSNSEFNGANSLNGIGINNLLTNYVDVDRTFGNIYGELRFLKLTRQDIRFRTSLSYDKTTIRDFIWQPAFFLGKFFSQDIARLNDNSRIYTNSAIENTLTYDKIVHKHVLNVLLGQSYREGNTLLRESHAEGFTTPYYPEINNGATKSAKGSEFENTLVSFFGRINYSYDDRYLLIATIRRDGSSRFSPDNKYGNFPSASAGWKISNEKFWSVSKNIITSLKLRGSYGLLGNQNIGDYLYFGSINSGVVYTFDGTRVVGGLQTQIASPNVKWESKATTNIGFDGSFLNGALDLSAEYYNAKSSDILVNLPIPASVGYTNSNPVANAASLKNSGIEITAAYHKTSGDFTFDLSANFSTLKNEVVELGGHEDPIYGVGAKTQLGGIVGEHYGFVYEGIFQTQAEITAHATQFGAALKPGDVKYKDISGPLGKPDGVVDEAYDRTYLGSGIPKYYYGITFSAAYKRFDLLIFASGAANFKINSRMYRDLHHSAGSLNYSTDMLKRWTPSNTNTDIPRLNDADVNNFKDSDRPGWLQSGTYLRINTVSIGYNFPGDIIKGLSKSRVFVTGQNLYTFQKYTGYNPDFTSGVFNPGFDFGSYPKPRTIMVGVQLIF
ncbi:MAG: TonB-dependent receptor [Bacteroidetes bacterium]|nr:MAG: TonB-dependent receptor [Bacteroidota bacterium]